MIDLDFNDNYSNEYNASNYFLIHMKKCFIAIDDDRSCEFMIVPEIDRYYHRNEEIYSDKLTKKDEINWKVKVTNYIKLKPHQYFKHIVDSRKKINTDILIDKKTPISDIKDIVKYDPKTIKCSTIDDNELFKKKRSQTDLQYSSGLSKLYNYNSIKSNIKLNMFLKYAKFDENANFDITTQCFIIYFVFENSTNKEPMKIRINRNAKISDLIGLSCFKYTNENRIPPLKYKNIDCYCLKIIEDDEIDYEFPALETFKSVSAFGFEQLALVENKNCQYESIFNVLILFSDGNPPEKLTFASDIQMKELLNYLLNKKKKDCPCISYILEHKESGIIVELDKYLSEFNKFEFYFYRKNSRKDVLNNNDHEKFIFQVDYLSKWRKIKFKLELSKEKLCLEEASNNMKTLVNIKPSSYIFPMFKILDCILIKEFHQIKICVIRLIIIDYDQEKDTNSHFYRYLDFEINSENANFLQKTVLKFINFSKNSLSDDYFNYKNKKIIKWSRKRHI